MKFLIVEDEIRIREGIRRLLPKLDPENEIAGEAENGERGLALIQKLRPDVIITDVRMPVMDGLAMLEAAYREGCAAKAIVLSAYSEFEYARSALRLGVTEYLLKPINLAGFSCAIERVKQEMERDRKDRPEKIGGLDQVLRNILNGDMELEDEVLDYLKQRFGINRTSAIALLVTYFEEWTEKNRADFLRKIKMILMERPGILYCIQEDEKQREIRLLLYNYRENDNMKRWIQGHFLRENEKVHGAAMGWTEVEDIRLLRENYEAVQQYLEWTIPMGDDVIISYPEILNIQTELCVYPLDIEEQMKAAVCAGDQEKTKKCLKRFQRYFQDKKLYSPQNIKDCYARFCWNMIHFLKEAGSLSDEDIDQRELLDLITRAKTRQGLEDAVTELLRERKDTRNPIDNLNVRRAVAMIHEFYRTGITLDEIAARLGITPEYLGTQFHQEMGINFSAYVRKFRIEKAKKLLLGTDMKLYEIAAQAGYMDAKYFSRVFKAETGMLPAEYRKTHK